MQALILEQGKQTKMQAKGRLESISITISGCLRLKVLEPTTISLVEVGHRDDC